VVLGGLLVSTFFTLVLVPTVFTVTMDARLAIGRWWQGESPLIQEPATIGTPEKEESPSLLDA
jgi:hypothetical protein